MYPEAGIPFWVALLFGLIIMFIIIILTPNRQNKPKYENSFHGGKPFPEEMFKRFEKMREENNPNNEPIGIINGRCQFCGSGKIDQKWKPTTPFCCEKKLIKNCGCCQLVIDSM